MCGEASITTKIGRNFLTHEGIPRTEGFAHGGVRRSTVSFDTDTHRKHLRNGREMPAASFFRRCWHPMVLQNDGERAGPRAVLPRDGPLRRGLLYSGLGVEPKKLVANYCNDFLMMAQKPQMSKKALPAQNISFASSLEGWRWRLDLDS